MANRERNKRAARKARQVERERVAAAQAASGMTEGSDKKSPLKSSGARAPQKAKATVAKADREGFGKVTGYFADVRSEMRQVTWPSRTELKNYSVAVIVMLVIFGFAIWLVDTGFVAGLVTFTGLRG